MKQLERGFTGTATMENDLQTLFFIKTLLDNNHKIRLLKNKEADKIIIDVTSGEFDEEIYGTDFLAFLDCEFNNLKITVIEETKEVILEYRGEQIKHFKVDYIAFGE